MLGQLFDHQRIYDGLGNAAAEFDVTYRADAELAHDLELAGDVEGKAAVEFRMARAVESAIRRIESRVRNAPAMVFQTSAAENPLRVGRLVLDALCAIGLVPHGADDSRIGVVDAGHKSKYWGETEKKVLDLATQSDVLVLDASALRSAGESGRSAQEGSSQDPLGAAVSMLASKIASGELRARPVLMGTSEDITAALGAFKVLNSVFDASTKIDMPGVKDPAVMREYLNKQFAAHGLQFENDSWRHYVNEHFQLPFNKLGDTASGEKLFFQAMEQVLLNQSALPTAKLDELAGRLIGRAEANAAIQGSDALVLRAEDVQDELDQMRFATGASAGLKFYLGSSLHRLKMIGERLVPMAATPVKNGLIATYDTYLQGLRKAQINLWNVIEQDRKNWGADLGRYQSAHVDLRSEGVIPVEARIAVEAMLGDKNSQVMAARGIQLISFLDQAAHELSQQAFRVKNTHQGAPWSAAEQESPGGLRKTMSRKAAAGVGGFLGGVLGGAVGETLGGSKKRRGK